MSGGPYGRIAVSVSGGPDSMALLLLLNGWCRKNGTALAALTVDHALRSESAAEAAQVAAWCKTLSMPHTTLRWQHDGVKGGMQERARNARYDLMLAWCRENGVAHLFTAHHLDDQIETFLFRLSRASGIEGLSGMLPVSMRQGIFIHRPLLSFSKAQLVATLGAHPYVSDPTNTNMRYTRNRLRAWLAALDEHTKKRIGALAFSFQKIRVQLECGLKKNLNNCFQFHDAGFGILKSANYNALPAAMQSRVLQHIAQIISGNAEPVRSEKIARLMDAISTPRAGKKITLHGVVFQWLAKEQGWLVMREASKIAPRAALSHTPQLWDGRFLLPAGNAGYSVGPLGTHARKFAKELAAAGIPKPAWPVICGLFVLETAHSVPHIHPAPDLCFVPAKLLAAGHDWAKNRDYTIFDGEKARAKFG